MSKRFLVLISLVIATSMLLAACSGGGGAAKTLKIVSSLPMTGSSLTQTQTIVNAEELRLAQANSSACNGKYTISYEAWDDASAAQGQWDPAVETENANKAAADPTIIAYLGTFNSGAAKLSIPILDKAGPLVMVSPANTYPGLTKPGYAPGEPDVYYPAGVRNYARVVTADDVQGTVDATFMAQQLSVKTVYILDDQQLYGKGIADVFEKTAKDLESKVLGHDGIDTKAADYKALMTKISTSNNGKPPDAIFVGMVVDSNAAQLLKDKVSIMGDNTKVKFVGPDGIQTQAFIDGAGADVADGVYASVAGLPYEKLPAAGQQFKKDYDAKYGGDRALRRLRLRGHERHHRGHRVRLHGRRQPHQPPRSPLLSSPPRTSTACSAPGRSTPTAIPADRHDLLPGSKRLLCCRGPVQVTSWYL